MSALPVELLSRQLSLFAVFVALLLLDGRAADVRLVCCSILLLFTLALVGTTARHVAIDFDFQWTCAAEYDSARSKEARAKVCER